MAEPVIRLDRSKNFSSHHGEMTPDDPHYNVRFWQGGTLIDRGRRHTVLLPFDAEGNLVPDDGKTAPYKGRDAEGKEVLYRPLYSDLQRKFRDAKLTLARQTAAAVAAGQPVIEEDEASGAAVADGLVPTNAGDEVDLPAWLRGEVEYQPHAIRSAVRSRYGHQHKELTDLVVDLVLDEKLVSYEQLGPRAKGFVDAYNEKMKHATL